MIRWLVLALSLTWGVAEAGDTVLFIESTEPSAAELRVMQELALALDDQTLRPLSLPDGFTAAPLTAQLEALRGPLAEPGVLAAAWLAADSQDPLRLQLAFAGEAGRTVVRIVDQPAGPGAEATLALAAREVLLTALIEPPPPPAPSTAPPPPPAAPGPRGAIGFEGGLSVGTSLRTGSPVRATLAAGGEVFLPKGFLVGAHAVFRLARTGELGPNSSGLGGGIRLAWIPGSKAFGVGPFAGLTAVWLRTSLLADEARLHADQLQLRVPVGLEVRIRTSSVLVVTARFSGDLLPRRNVVRRRSDGAIVVDTGPLDATVLFGLRAAL